MQCNNRLITLLFFYSFLPAFTYNIYHCTYHPMSIDYFRNCFLTNIQQFICKRTRDKSNSIHIYRATACSFFFYCSFYCSRITTGTNIRT